MTLPNFKIVSLADLDSPGTVERRTYLQMAPRHIIASFIRHLPKPKDQRVGKDVMLIHPIFGDTEYTLIQELHENQLDWIAEMWQKLCKERPEVFGPTKKVTPLLIAGERDRFVILENGMICRVVPFYQPEPASLVTSAGETEDEPDPFSLEGHLRVGSRRGSLGQLHH